MDTDVLVVGAGPTGLMLALQLARRDIRVRIIDRSAGPAEQTRAMAVHARTLEYYEALGIAREAIDSGRCGTGANLWADGRHAARIPVGDIGRGLSPFPFVLVLGQDDNERLLLRRLGEFGVEVERHTELVGLQERTDAAIATLRRHDGRTEEVAATWIAGCDGVHSAARELSGIAFEGAAYDDIFYVADTVGDDPMRSAEVNVHLGRDGFHLLFPMRTARGWRVIGIVPPTHRGRHDLRFDDLVPTLRAAIGPSLGFEACHWFSTYRVQHRCAERFRVGRRFLLGDAAHVHSPMGGQGMNTGLQDACNLGWKLAAVVAGADASLLDTYELERRPVALRLLESTDRAFGLVVGHGWLARLFRTRVIGRVAAHAMRFESVRRRAFTTLSQIGISYRRSPLSCDQSDWNFGALAAGDRLPWVPLTTADGRVVGSHALLDDRRHTLLLVGTHDVGAAVRLGNVAIRSVRLAGVSPSGATSAEPPLPEQAMLLVRPDGHIALAGRSLDCSAVSKYLARWEAAEPPASHAVIDRQRRQHGARIRSA